MVFVWRIADDVPNSPNFLTIQYSFLHCLGFKSNDQQQEVQQATTQHYNSIPTVQHTHYDYL